MTTCLSPLRVLIVDDLSQVRHDLRVLLELTGTVEVVGAAADGQEAVDLTEQLHPDIVLMDLAMPGMDGWVATREIKERALARRVVILSVHGDPASVARAHAAGADALVLKGAPLETLLSAIVGGQNRSKT
jgi:DNA-binding NarL/FixJ family response regulator